MSAPIRVLVVEDDDLNRGIFERCLSDRGFDVATAASAEAGLEAAAGSSFDVILLDIMLPGISGLAAIPLFAARSAAGIIVMTGHADEELKKDAVLLGAKGFVSKPPDLGALAALIEETARKSS